MALCEYETFARAIWSADGLIYFFVTVKGLGCIWVIWLGGMAHAVACNVTAPLWS